MAEKRMKFTSDASRRKLHWIVCRLLHTPSTVAGLAGALHMDPATARTYLNYLHGMRIARIIDWIEVPGLSHRQALWSIGGGRNARYPRMTHTEYMRLYRRRNPEKYEAQKRQQRKKSASSRPVQVMPDPMVALFFGLTKGEQHDSQGRH